MNLKKKKELTINELINNIKNFNLDSIYDNEKLNFFNENLNKLLNKCNDDTDEFFNILFNELSFEILDLINANKCFCDEDNKNFDDFLKFRKEEVEKYEKAKKNKEIEKKIIEKEIIEEDQNDLKGKCLLDDKAFRPTALEKKEIKAKYDKNSLNRFLKPYYTKDQYL